MCIAVLIFLGVLIAGTASLKVSSMESRREEYEIYEYRKGDKREEKYDAGSAD